MGIPRPDFFDFLFNGGRGIRKNQVDWSGDDPAFDGLITQLMGSINSTRFLTSVPSDGLGIDGDTALVRLSPIVVHAYRKIAGTWVRQWAFHGGDAVFLADLPAIPDRRPATDPSAATFTRYLGMSGYSPITADDVDQAMGGTIDSASDMRGGNHGTQTGARANTLPNQQFGNDLEDYSGLRFDPSFNGIYLWFGINTAESTGLSITSVSYNGADVPVTKQTDQITLVGNAVDVWVSDNTYAWADIKDHPFVLTLEKDASAPNTWNRYAVVTANPVPTAADFLHANARTSASTIIFIPNSGWVDGRGYLHFALPAAQDAPTIAGLPGGINLIPDFDVRSRAAAIDINGDDMRTLSSEEMVWQMTDRFGLFPWIVR